MSFVRFAEDSELYIIEHAEDATHPEPFKACWNCGLLGSSWKTTGVHHFETTDLDAMLAHVEQHRSAGHRVPDWLEQSLREDWIE